MACCIFTLRRITATVFVVNLVLTSFTVYIFLSRGPRNASKPLPLSNSPSAISGKVLDDDDNWNPWGSDLMMEEDVAEKNDVHPQENKASLLPPQTIEIWSKAAIGIYLWEHILRGRYDKRTDNDYYVYGFKKYKNYKFKYRSGPSLTPHGLRHFFSESSNQNPHKNLIIVLNGRAEDKVKVAKTWLDELKLLTMQYKTANVGAILLGNESCFNQWIKTYLEQHGGPLKFIFIVYDWKYINDDDIYQWPLGVATYRNFPLVDSTKLDLENQRQYACNFLGTVYKNTSREEIAKTLEKFELESFPMRNPPACYVKTRAAWLPNETPDTLQLYLDALKFSDLTLSPIGFNHECYRIYEALSFGSIPVIEENLHHVADGRSNCDHKQAYRLLKSHGVPAIFVSNWTRELPAIIRNELMMTLDKKIQRRKQALSWYANFKSQMRDKLINVIEKKFSFI